MKDEVGNRVRQADEVVQEAREVCTCLYVHANSRDDSCGYLTSGKTESQLIWIYVATQADWTSLQPSTSVLVSYCGCESE